MDHCYSKQKEQQKERIPSVFGTTDHCYNKICDNTCRTPTNNRKRERSTPTGKTPQQPSKIGTAVISGQKRNTPWTDPEKEYFIQYVQHTPRSETLTDYWQKCASAMNAKFPSGMRNGHACKSLAQRLYVIPSTRLSTSDSETVTDVPGCRLLPSTVDVSTQTTLTLPVNTDCVVGGPACMTRLTYFKSAPIPSATDEIMRRIQLSAFCKLEIIMSFSCV